MHFHEKNSIVFFDLLVIMFVFVFFSEKTFTKIEVGLFYVLFLTIILFKIVAVVLCSRTYCV